MANIDNIDIFIPSTLKVTASEDLDIQKDLESENASNKSIDELLAENNESKKE
jgi:hypothetical protein